MVELAGDLFADIDVLVESPGQWLSLEDGHAVYSDDTGGLDSQLSGVKAYVEALFP